MLRKLGILLPMETTLTAASLALFLDLADDAGNWSGSPLVDISNSERGNLTHLKREGLITTMESDGFVHASFTPTGAKLAAEHGIDLSYYV